jgi:hypothetical protein
MIITDFLVCDDVRHEINGKMALAGIYNEFVILNEKKDVKFPMSFRLGIYARIKIQDSDKMLPDAFDFEFSQGGNREVVVKKGKMDINVRTNLFALTILFGNFPIKSDERVQFKIRFYKSDVQICELEPDYAMNVIFKGDLEKS